MMVYDSGRNVALRFATKCCVQGKTAVKKGKFALLRCYPRASHSRDRMRGKGLWRLHFAVPRMRITVISLESASLCSADSPASPFLTRGAGHVHRTPALSTASSSSSRYIVGATELPPSSLFSSKRPISLSQISWLLCLFNPRLFTISSSSAALILALPLMAFSNSASESLGGEYVKPLSCDQSLTLRVLTVDTEKREDGPGFVTLRGLDRVEGASISKSRLDSSS